ncbi:MAG: hypothetical protein RIC19_09135 [Phaeodactylibacter sp.]|uniref:hypothetical protein n=1 Tax=Phaeodactylibacter sp. TaxID=1940289 RepID=UPI0032EC2593
MDLKVNSFGVYLRFRVRQLGRILYSAGIPGVIALPLLLIFVLQGLEAMAKVPGWVIPLLTSFFILNWHFRRKDSGFLKRTGFAVGWIFGIEYAVVASCAALPLIAYTANWGMLPVAAAGAFVCGFLPEWSVRQNLFLPVMGWGLPGTLFEWRSALRRYGALFSMLWLFSLAASYGLAVLLIVMLLWASLIPSVFEYQEPRELTIAVVVKGGGLFRHWLRHFWLQLMVFTPGLLLHLVFHPAYWYLALIGLSFIALMLAFAMAYKYATWQPGRQRVVQSLPVTLAYFSLFFPLLLPVVGFYLLRFVKRARHHFKMAYDA